MTDDPGLIGRLRSRGEEMLTQVSAELSQNPRFMRAMAGAMRGKEALEQAVSRVLRQMNVPSRSELKRATARIDALEREVAALKRRTVGKGGSARSSKPSGAKGAKGAKGA